MSLQARELEGKLHRALEKLPERCREVFLLSRKQQLKYAEIASVMNISIKTVENQMGKALKILHQELREYLPFNIFLTNDRGMVVAQTSSWQILFNVQLFMSMLQPDEALYSLLCKYL